MPDGTYRSSDTAYRTYIIDSCEYFGILDRSNGNFLSHKGNCSYCKERRQQEIKELIKMLKEE